MRPGCDRLSTHGLVEQSYRAMVLQPHRNHFLPGLGMAKHGQPSRARERFQTLMRFGKTQLNDLRPTVQVIDDWVTNRKLALVFEAKLAPANWSSAVLI